MLVACSPVRPLPEDEVAAAQGPDANVLRPPAKEMPVDSSNSPAASTGEGLANLPFSHGKSFRTLDEYLAHLERYAGPIDQPWWREIRPGVYEHVKRMPGAPREQATRAQLMERFGFSS
jgi:hypothetical protein